MKNNNRIGQSEISDAVAKSVAAELQRIIELQNDQITAVNGAVMPKIGIGSSILASVLPDLEDIAIAGMFPKMEIPDFS